MKRGVSPIIASVILIAITVSVAFMIFKFSTGFITGLSPPADCAAVSFNAGIYSSDGGQIIEVENTGSENIVGFELMIEDSSLGSADAEQIAMALPIGQSASKEITFTIPTNAKITAKPQIIQNSKLSTCDEPYAKQIVLLAQPAPETDLN